MRYSRRRRERDISDDVINDDDYDDNDKHSTAAWCGLEFLDITDWWITSHVILLTSDLVARQHETSTSR